MPEQLPIFPDLPGPSFMPIMPPPNSAAALALYDLVERNITQIDWLREGKGWRLAAAVKELGYLGWEPDSIRMQCDGWARPIAVYALSAKAKRYFFALRRPGGGHA